MLTREQLAADLAHAEAKRDEQIAEVNAIIGRIAYIKHLLTLEPAAPPKAPRKK
jgi:hypothetical protein